MNPRIDWPRLGRCALASIPYLAVWVVLGFVLVPEDERVRWILTFAPLAAVISIGMDYFVWRTPEREARREAKREANRPNIRL